MCICPLFLRLFNIIINLQIVSYKITKFMNNGKIYEWLNKNRYWILSGIVCCITGLVLLHACQSRVELLVKGNKVNITKTKSK